jgi:uroporphyrin-3 C-methyltransferase
MSEQPPSDEPTATQALDEREPTAAEAPRERPPRRSASVHVGVLAAVVFAAVAMLVWQWYDTRNQIAALEQELARRLTAGDARNQEAVRTAESVRARLHELAAQVSTVESGLAESQNQQVALEALYQQLSRSSDEWALAEVEQTLNIAAQQLQLAGNVKAALIALQSADARLQRLDRPQLAPLRKVIEGDIERLQRSPFVDVVGLTVKIDHLMDAVDTLPLAMQQRPPPEPAAASAAKEPNVFLRLAREMWQDLRSLVRIQNLERPEVPLIDPGQTFFLRENLTLRLLSARIALLQRDGRTYRSDLQAALEWVERFYDTREPGVSRMINTLQQLARVDIGVEVPDIDASLNAVRDYKLTRERTPS